MHDVRFQISGAALLDKLVQKLDKFDMGDRDTKGDLYEYMLAKIATAGRPNPRMIQPTTHPIK